MKDRRLENYLKTLTRDDPWPHGQWKEALAYCKETAEDGSDISPAARALAELFKKCRNIDILALAADSLVMQYLNTRDYAALSSLAKKKESHNEMADALCRYTMKGKVPSSAIFLLAESLAFSWISQYRIYDALAYYIGKDRERMHDVLSLMNDRPWLKQQIPAMLKASMIVIRRFDDEVLPCTLPFLVPLLSDEKLKGDAIAVLRWIVALRVDITPALPAIRALLGDSSEAVRRQAAFCNAVHQVDQVGDFIIIDRHLADARVSVRTGALDALGFFLNQRLTYRRESLSRAARMLVDRDGAIRKLAFLILERALRAGIDCDSGIDVATYLALHCHEGDESLVRFLLFCVENNAEVAHGVRHVLEASPSRDSDEMAMLIRHCREIEEGTHVPSCTICRFLPRESCCSLESDVPKEAMKLQPEKPMSEPGLRRCPECGTYYMTSYSIEYESPTDGMSVDIDIGIKRLTPPEALHIVGGDEGEAFRKSYDGLIEKAVRLLGHPERYLREDGACTLTLHYLGKRDWEGISHILHKDDDIIRRACLTMLSQGAMSECAHLVGSIEAVLHGTNPDIKKQATMLLARYYIHIRNSEKLREMAELDDSIVTAASLQMILSDEAVDLKPFLPVIRKSLASDDENLRYQAKNALIASIDRKMDVSGSSEALCALLSHQKKRIRDHARAVLKLVEARAGTMP